ncbi:MAG TPA: hypothetical protein VGY99_08415 [Candidatus Binataceae bacterium]|jgi:hypothetical protein|nr:hypothetical protein [Candidatus Binataceae bacterium]
MADSSRGAVLTVCAILFALLALSNFSKPFHMSPNVGFVFLGGKTHGIANAILGPAFGLLLIFYAVGIWRMRRWALPIGFAYAAYVILNLSLYSIRNAGSPEMPPPVSMFGYIVVAVGVSAGSALLLYRRRDLLV